MWTENPICVGTHLQSRLRFEMQANLALGAPPPRTQARQPKVEWGCLVTPRLMSPPRSRAKEAPPDWPNPPAPHRPAHGAVRLAGRWTMVHSAERFLKLELSRVGRRPSVVLARPGPHAHGMWSIALLRCPVRGHGSQFKRTRGL